MDDRMEFINRLNMFFLNTKGSPTRADLEAFIESLTDDERKQFLVALLVDSLAGLAPPSVGKGMNA